MKRTGTNILIIGLSLLIMALAFGLDRTSMRIDNLEHQLEVLRTTLDMNYEIIYKELDILHGR